MSQFRVGAGYLAVFFAVFAGSFTDGTASRVKFYWPNNIDIFGLTYNRLDDKIRRN